MKIGTMFPQDTIEPVAKQAATPDLGLGAGWSHVEYEALGMAFGRRGRFFDEQIDVLRPLWTERAVANLKRLEEIRRVMKDAGVWEDAA